MRQLITSALLILVDAVSIGGQVPDSVTLQLQEAQYDLATDGQAFLLREAAGASFFLLGELHGENEIPALIRAIWPSMWKTGYRNVAAEISPWAANQLEFGDGHVPVFGLWTQPEATFVASLKRNRAVVLWGCDIEEAQPDPPLRLLAAANPGN